MEALKTGWQLNTKMPEFTLQIWAMTKLTEVLHSKQVTQLDIEKIPKMIRGSMIRNLAKFSRLRRLMFGSSSGEMTIHITKGASLYTNLCSAVRKMERLVQLSLQYNCTNDILRGNYEKTIIAMFEQFVYFECFGAVVLVVKSHLKFPVLRVLSPRSFAEC